jgi:hypothetical protein
VRPVPWLLGYNVYMDELNAIRFHSLYGVLYRGRVVRFRNRLADMTATG